MNKKIVIILAIVVQLFSINDLYSQRWEKVSIPGGYSTTYWLDVYFLPSNPNYGWVCGFQGSILRTTDGGGTWQGTRISGANHLESVHFPSSSIGYTSGQQGIYKSTDGGANWTDITPSSSTIGLWGCYFLDNNNGFVIGGGCTTNQYFWRTTDGGNNWSFYLGSEPNTGLTDLIVYNMSGLGFASSSGWIWQTNDGGNTWSKWSNTGAHDWQEEITRVGSSFLVPYSTGCSGGGGSGGMRYTSDNGVTWRDENTGQPMFGTFLLNANTGWTAGDNRNVWYTSDAGVNWELRNCGFDAGNLDDIWFISPTNGWIVGEGVYRLANPLQTSDRSELIFNELCIPNYQELQIILDNINFNDDQVDLSIINDPLNEFSIERPGNSFTIGSCESERVTVRFTPQVLGLREAQLRVEFGYGTVIFVDLSGMGNLKTAYPVDTLLTINPAYCNNHNYGNIRWDSETDRESIRFINRSGGDPNIFSLSQMPYAIPSNGTQTLFSAMPIDTGWITSRYYVDFLPCAGDTFLTVQAYGVSPIITAQSSYTFSQQCNPEKIDTITIFNTGNDDLLISDTRVVESQTNFTVLGWVDNLTYPFTIPVDSVEHVIIKYVNSPTMSDSATLSIQNNDSTKVRGDKNPFNISLIGKFGKSELFAQDSVLDFGNVCIGADERMVFFFKNIGNLPLELANPVFDSLQFTIEFDALQYPIVLDEKDSVRCSIYFNPDKTGIISDTISFEALPCNQIVKIFVTGNGINAGISPTPNTFSENLQTKQTFSKTVRIQSTGTEDLTLMTAEFSPMISNIQLNVNPPLTQFLAAGDYIDFDIEITADVDTVYDGFICFTATGNCDCGACIPIHLESFSANVGLNKTSIDFGTNLCSPRTLSDTAYAINTGFIADTITDIILTPNNADFNVTFPALPYTIEADDSLYLYIDFSTVNEGNHSATITMNTAFSGNVTKEISLLGEYRKVESEPDLTSFDYGIMEQCDIPLEEIITISNVGTLVDSILISSANSLTTISPSDYLIVGANSSEQISVIFDPTQHPTGVLDDTLFLESTICPDIDTIYINAETYHHYLSYFPNEIQFIDPWFDEMNFSKIIIKNESQYPKSISSLKMFEDNNFKIVNNYNFPFLLQTNDSLVVPISFFSDVEGIFFDSLELVEESICIDTSIIQLTADIPVVEFNTNISFGNYIARPGENINIAVSIDTAFTLLRHKGINYEFSFDPYLFHPSALIIKQQDGGFTIPIENYSDGVMSGFIDTTFSKNLLKQTGEIILINGLVLLSNPDSTDLVINRFEPVTSRDITVNYFDGSLNLTKFCDPIADFRLLFKNRPTLKLYDNPIEFGVLNYSLQSEESTEVNISIVSVNGNILSENKHKVNDGKNKYQLDVSNLSSGMYFVTFQINSYLFKEKIIVFN